jgi:hypothetical protein
MRYLAAVSWLVLISSCAPVREPVTPRPVPIEDGAKPTATTAKPAAPSHTLELARATRREIAGIIFEGVAFDARSHRLVVVDQSGGPDSQFPDAASAGLASGGIAAVNAGFFTPEGDPLGLVVSAGKPAGAWNSASSLGSGVWHEDSSGQSAISRREQLGRSRATSMRELLQAGPMLIENGNPVSGLDPTKASVRTVILWDGGSRWWIGRASVCSLANLATALASGNPAGWPVRHALNLDGGRSSDLWISEITEGGPVSKRSPWNRPVRNFLVLAPR